MPVIIEKFVTIFFCVHREAFAYRNNKGVLRFVIIGNAFEYIHIENALYNILWGTLPDCFMAQFTIFLMQQVVFSGAPRTE